LPKQPLGQPCRSPSGLRFGLALTFACTMAFGGCGTSSPTRAVTGGLPSTTEPAAADERNSSYALEKLVDYAKPPMLFDVSAFDPGSRSYLFSDITNSSVDIIDARTDTLQTMIPGIPGPSGIVVISGTHQAWIGDADSQIKVLDLRTDQVIDTISTNGQLRTDELAYDPADHIVVVENDLDSPPFITLISTSKHRIIRTIRVPDATHGLEAPLWDSEMRRFYVADPTLTTQPGGALLMMDAQGNETGRLTFAACHPAGIAALPARRLFIGCDTSVRIVDATNGRTVFSDPTGATSSDEVSVALGSDLAFAATSVGVAVVDIRTGRLTQMISTPPGAHSLAVNPTNAQLFVPVPGYGAALFGQIGKRRG
jgi:hypothetical protein